MKKLLFGLIAIVLFSNFSFSQNDLNLISDNISARQDFNELINQLSKFSESLKDINIIKELGEKGKLTDTEKQLLIENMGFESQQSAYDFDINNNKIIAEIYSELKLDRLSKDELLAAFTLAINKVKNIASSQLSNRRTCEAKFKSCKTGAWGVYLVEQAGCASAGIGIGALSFWCAGCAGAGVYAACATGASMHMSSMLGDCQDAYDSCK